MPFQTNSYYADPAIGSGIESLGRAIFGNPEDKVKRAVAEAQGRYYGAQTAKTEAETAAKRAQLDAAQNIGTDIGSALFAQAQGPNIDGSAGYTVSRTPDEIRANVPAVLNRAALAYQNSPAALGDIFRLIGAMSGNDALARQGMVATGVTPGEKFALTPERADNIRAQGYADAQARERMQQDGANYREGIQSGDRRYGVDQREAGLMSRRYDNPLNVNDGNTVFFSPGDPRAPAAAQPQGEGMGSIFTVPVNPTSSNRVPLDISPSDIKSLRETIATFVPEGFVVSPEDTSTVVNRAAELYQQTRNAQTASAKAWEEIFGDNSNTEGVGNMLVQNRVLPKKKDAPAAGGTPGTPASGAKKTPQQLVEEAKDAIARGADPAKVRERLQKMGVTMSPDA